MDEGNPHPPGLPGLLRKAALTALAAFEIRGEIFLVELEQEKSRLMESLIWGAAVCFFGMMFVVVLTGTVIFLFPEDCRIYAAAGFCLLYLLGAVLAWLNLKAFAKGSTRPFSGTVEELKKDRQWLESLK
jgi:uncharacterized membrane protein YqjE